jgi:DnaJ-class molecular chaperone
MVQVTTCPDCGGTGRVITQHCKVCNGRGHERKTVKKVIPIPAGVDNGTQIRLSGEGQPGVNGGPRGNLYIEVKVKPHKYFRRRGDDVLLDLNINIAQAALGAEIKVPTLEGDEKLIIPPAHSPVKFSNCAIRGLRICAAAARRPTGDRQRGYPRPPDQRPAQAVRAVGRHAGQRSATSGTQFHGQTKGRVRWIRLTGSKFLWSLPPSKPKR